MEMKNNIEFKPSFGNYFIINCYDLRTSTSDIQSLFNRNFLNDHFDLVPFRS